MSSNEKLIAFQQQYRGKTASVIGIGISNKPLITFLLDNLLSVVARDKKEKSAIDGAVALEENGVKLVCGEKYLNDLHEDIIFRTPGMRPDQPALMDAKEKGSVITSEIELLFDLCPCPIFAVTGSDGKTTTTTLVSLFLQEAGYHVHIGGNIGTPLLARVPEMKPTDITVLELSSFQLMSLHQSPVRAVITNLSENHLDWHTNMDEYLRAKMNILLHQTPQDWLVLNAGNEITNALTASAKGQVLHISSRGNVENGVCLDGEIIYRVTGGIRTPIMTRSDIRIPGLHNVENYMAAIALTQGLVSDDIIKKVASTFPGVPHRCQFIREKNGVKYYNSSIDSTPVRTKACLHAFKQKVIVICGGYDKQLSFEPLGPLFFDHAQGVILCGATTQKIKDAITQYPGYTPNVYPIYETASLVEAVKTAEGIAGPGDIVVLSPACASFDVYKNFEERGECFVQTVNNL
jgi:UDP-N-acetylmuramoylalanine--D-glutamate ligase